MFSSAATRRNDDESRTAPLPAAFPTVQSILYSSDANTTIQPPDHFCIACHATDSSRDWRICSCCMTVEICSSECHMKHHYYMGCLLLNYCRARLILQQNDDEQTRRELQYLHVRCLRDMYGALETPSRWSVHRRLPIMTVAHLKFLQENLELVRLSAIESFSSTRARWSIQERDIANCMALLLCLDKPECVLSMFLFAYWAPLQTRRRISLASQTNDWIYPVNVTKYDSLPAAAVYSMQDEDLECILLVLLLKMRIVSELVFDNKRFTYAAKTATSTMRCLNDDVVKTIQTFVVGDPRLEQTQRAAIASLVQSIHTWNGTFLESLLWQSQHLDTFGVSHHFQAYVQEPSTISDKRMDFCWPILLHGFRNAVSLLEEYTVGHIGEPMDEDD